MWLVAAPGAVCIVALFSIQKGTIEPRRLLWIALGPALAASAPLGYAANLGGRVQHEEVRPELLLWQWFDR